MALEFWRNPRKPRRPKQPVPVGKAQQMLSAAIIMGDHELASFLDGATVCGKPEAIAEFRKRLDSVMAPNP